MSENSKMGKIKDEITQHLGQVVEITTDSGSQRHEKRQKVTILEAYDAHFLVIYDQAALGQKPTNIKETFTYADILTGRVIFHGAVKK
jgi:uncharacterized protein Veg